MPATSSTCDVPQVCLDHARVGLDLCRSAVGEVARVIIRLKESRITVLLVEQNARVALSLADRGYVLERGRVVLADRSDRLVADPEIQRSYLGGARAVR